MLGRAPRRIFGRKNPSGYRSYRDLPPLAGIGTTEEAMRLGPGIDYCVARSKRHHWGFRRRHEIFI